jgi:PEP-CTERM/exosortase A-associated glycosyltransferase
MGFGPVVLTSPKHEENWKGPWQPVEDIDGFRYYRTGEVSSNGIPLESELRLMYALSKRIKEVIRFEKPDLLHAHSPVLNAVSALWVGRVLKMPVVYEIRAFWEDAAVDHRTCTTDSLRYKLTKEAETWVCRKADQIGVLCHGIKQDLVKRGIRAEKLTIIQNGINPEDFQPREPNQEYQKEWRLDGRTVIGFIGSFYRYEGLDLLINGFAQIADKFPEAVLLLVGGGEMESELKQLVSRLDCQRTQYHQHLGFPASQLKSRILFPGRISHNKIPGVYAMVDILVYPRYRMRLTDLVTPLKPLEAMAMGKVLIASDVGGHKELIKHEQTGLLFQSDNVD